MSVFARPRIAVQEREDGCLLLRSADPVAGLPGQALLAAYNPHTAGSGLRWGGLAPSPPGARPDSSSPYAASAGYRAAAESLAAESLTGPAFPA
jgi:hypothetical protein